MPITAAEYNTFYFIAKLIRQVFPGHRLYVAREKNLAGKVLSYHAGVAKYEGKVMKDIIMASGNAGKRVDALDTLLGDLEDYVHYNFEQIEAERRARDAELDAELDAMEPSSEEEDEGGKRKGKAPGGRGADTKPRLDTDQSLEKGDAEMSGKRKSSEDSSPVRVKARAKREDRELKEGTRGGQAPMSSSITDLEFQTFYVVTKLLDAVYPNGKLYLSHGLSTERDSYRYRAAVVESKIESSGSVKRRLLSQVETAKTRIGVLEAVRKRLEEIASWRLDVIMSDKERDDVEENERKRKNLRMKKLGGERRAEQGWSQLQEKL
ncbi:uncharacterized protein J4E78_001407 [Alternaria triticimaculans]|uniref:uncharacterized protein n=1 Tax=Alternaria triticimaculans TaxID=297637 RepID=UPI0020C3575A|nr:uncharacterized protein J4E78_001407 [Alternaria triticimaculans]KAI4672904.1 hypothetical protein J4E78_001407 [Alternaria triticimaculans]